MPDTTRASTPANRDVRFLTVATMVVVTYALARSAAHQQVSALLVLVMCALVQVVFLFDVARRR